MPSFLLFTTSPTFFIPPNQPESKKKRLNHRSDHFLNVEIIKGIHSRWNPRKKTTVSLVSFHFSFLCNLARCRFAAALLSWSEGCHAALFGIVSCYARHASVMSLSSAQRTKPVSLGTWTVLVGMQVGSDCFHKQPIWGDYLSARRSMPCIRHYFQCDWAGCWGDESQSKATKQGLIHDRSLPP